MTGRSAYEGITEKPQSQIHESAEKSNTSSLHQNMACLQVFSPFQPSMQFLKVLALLPALNICIHPSWYAFTTCSSYQSVSKPTNCQNNIHLQVIFCKKSWLNVFIGGFFCTNASLYRKLFFCNGDNFSSAQDFKWKREVNSFKQEH